MQSERSMQQQPNITNTRALVVDDDRAILMAIARSLTTVGIEVITASTGGEASAQLAAHEFSVILLDVELPDTNGFQLARQIRANAKTALLPIVMVTSHDDVDTIENSYQCGATDYIAKPINWLILGKRILFLISAHQNLAKLHQSQSFNLGILNAMPDSTVVLDKDLRILELRAASNEALAKYTEYAKGLSLPQLLPIRLLNRVRKILNTAFESQQTQTEEFNFSAGEIEHHYEMRVAATEDQKYVAVVRDIGERKAIETRMRQLAYSDSLTGLANRQALREVFTETLQQAEENQCFAACIYIDLDQFKRINDTLGHSAGDALLIEVARRLRRNSRPAYGITCHPPQYNLARLGGDEFTLVMGDLRDVRSVELIAQRMLDALATPIRIGNHDVVVTPSIGISMYPAHGQTVEELLKYADSAMYQAKSSGRNNFQFYDNRQTAQNMRHFEMENSLREAPERNEIFMVYQPQFDTQSRALFGVEALARWRHPKLGAVPPSDFIPLAENSGLIIPLGSHFLELIGKQICSWQTQGLPATPVSINISPRQFQRGDLVSVLRNFIAKYELNADMIDLELTEGMIMDHTKHSLSTLHELKDLGFLLSVDDFGTGYSSLSYLKRLPLNRLKIDQSFVKDIKDTHDCSSIADTIIIIAHRMKMQVIAEGVETEVQFEYLRQRGCDCVQGYLLSHPLSATASTTFMQAQTPSSPAIQKFA